MDENNGVAFAALVLATTSMGRLVANGVITKSQAKEDVDRALLLMEQMSLSPEANRAARETLDGVLRAMWSD